MDPEFLAYLAPEDEDEEVNHRFRGRHEVGWRPGESDYANRKNYTSCAEYLSSTLATYGWPQPVALDKSTNDMVTITNALYQALTAHQALQKDGRELKEKHFIVSQDCKRAEVKVRSQAGQIKKLELEKGQGEEQRRLADKQHALELRKLKEQHSESEKRFTAMQRRDNQSKHEMRKREKEYRVLQAKCARIVMDRMKDAPNVSLLDISSSMQSPSGTRTRRSPGARGSVAGSVAGAEGAELELLQGNLAAYEEQHHKDLAENRELRDTLLSLHTELQAMEEEHGGLGDTVTPKAVREILALQDSHFYAPFDIASEFIKPAMRAHVAVIGSKLRSPHTPGGLRTPVSIGGTPPTWAAKSFTFARTSTKTTTTTTSTTTTTDASPISPIGRSSSGISFDETLLVSPTLSKAEVRARSPRRVRKTWGAASPLVMATIEGSGNDSVLVEDVDVT